MTRRYFRSLIGPVPRLIGDLRSIPLVVPAGPNADEVKRQLDGLCRGFQSFCDELRSDPNWAEADELARRFSSKSEELRQELTLTLEAASIITKDFYRRNPKTKELNFTHLSELSDRLINIADHAFGLIEKEVNSKEITTRQAKPSRLDKLEQALNAEGYDGAPIRRLVEELFPELTQDVSMPGVETPLASPDSVPLPTKAPETYQGLRGPETPPEFVKRVYGPWLGQGLTRADIRKLDPKLSVAITNWLSRPGNAWPADVDLPTKAEQNERLLSAGPEAIREHLGKFTGQEALREAARINAAAHYRK